MNRKTLDSSLAARIAAMALACVHREFPNKISHVLNSGADVLPPSKLTPAFYGCYDWHSAVHTHWTLARLARLFPEDEFAPAAKRVLRQSLTAENIAQEVEYLNAPGRQSFERPYGLAWLLQLAEELHEWQTEDAQVAGLAAGLRSLELAARKRLSDWLPKLPCPVRSGEHSQTAFALGLMLDYARSKGDKHFAELLAARARSFYLNDKSCPLEYEPSGEDFLSPGLAEADLIRRVLGPAEFAAWVGLFLPRLADPLKPVTTPDPSDPKFSHLNGLNLSRAWMLEGIASALSVDDPRFADLLAASVAHAEAGLKAVSGEHYVGAHWLGTFAVYLLTKRGIRS
jgi:hypothetical protein